LPLLEKFHDDDEDDDEESKVEWLDDDKDKYLLDDG